MNNMTIGYISLFLIVCFVITVLSLLQSFFRYKKMKQLSTKLVTDDANLKQAQEEIHQLHAKISALNIQAKISDIDPVTHLMGFRLFLDRLNQRIKEAERFQLTLAVIFIDMEDLTMMTDALGSEINHLLLEEVTERINANIRKVDSAARYNATNIAILLSQITKPETAVIVVERIHQALKKPFFIQNRELYINTSFGIATYPADARGAETLLNCAQHALQLAKNTGLYRFYQEDMHKQSQLELMLQTSVAKEIFDDDFVIYYQPIHNVKENRVICVDTLPYWHHAQVGTLNSVELLNYAEKHQKSDVIFEWLLKNACENYLASESARVSSETNAEQTKSTVLIGIPLNLDQLHSHFIYRISKILQTLNFNPECVLLEMKHGLQMISFDVLEKSINMLNYLKIKICITDFGQETLSLGLLKNIKPNFVKTDPLLISDIAENKHTVALMESILFLMKKMNMELIVAGVDSEKKYQALKQLDVIYMQGSYFGLPIVQGEVVKKIAEYMV